MIYWAKVQKRIDNTERNGMILLLIITFYHPDRSFRGCLGYFSKFWNAKIAFCAMTSASAMVQCNLPPEALR